MSKQIFELREGEMLVDTVTRMLEEHGHSNPRGWQQGLSEEAWTNHDISVQIFLVNNQWKHILGMHNVNSGKNTQDQRMCLVNTPKIEDWVRLFMQGVLPCIMINNLGA